MPTEQNGFSTPSNDFGSLFTEKTKPISFGMKLVGISFNPSGDEGVNKAKQLCADLADLLYEANKNSETSELKNVLLPATYASILAAQMNVVKILTLKY